MTCLESGIGTDLRSLLGRTDHELSGNPWEYPPAPVVAKGLGAINKYFEELERTAAVLVDVRKVVFIGHGGAGKTRYVSSCVCARASCATRGQQSPWLILSLRAVIPLAHTPLVLPCFGRSIAKSTADG